MQTQRDHVHAHTFMMGRISSALIDGDPTNAEIPGRRAQTGMLIGLVLFILVTGGFAVYGWIVPGGSKAYQQRGVILVEKETGTRFVYLDGVLHPTLNQTSAMLIQGSSATVKLISKSSLTGLPRGKPLGILGAPLEMPGPGALVAGPWLACVPGSVVDEPGSGVGVNLDPAVAVTSLSSDAYALVKGPDATEYVVADGVRHRVGEHAALVALGAGTSRAVVTPQAWLDQVPAGTALQAATIPQAGAPGPTVDGRSHRVGTLFRQRDDDQFFVLREDGLAPMSRTEFLLADAEAREKPIDVDADALVHAEHSPDRTLLNRLPELSTLHRRDVAGQVLCVQQRATSATTITSRIVLVARQDAGVDSTGHTTVLMPAGGGMLVSDAGPSRRLTQKLSLICADGVVYDLADAETASALKLGQVPAVPFPRTLLAALPHGSVLSRASATATRSSEG